MTALRFFRRTMYSGGHRPCWKGPLLLFTCRLSPQDRAKLLAGAEYGPFVFLVFTPQLCCDSSYVRQPQWNSRGGRAGAFSGPKDNSISHVFWNKKFKRSSFHSYVDLSYHHYHSTSYCCIKQRCVSFLSKVSFRLLRMQLQSDEDSIFRLSTGTGQWSAANAKRSF